MVAHYSLCFVINASLTDGERVHPYNKKEVLFFLDKREQNSFCGESVMVQAVNTKATLVI